MDSIPIVDIGLARREEDWKDISVEIDTALSEVGFLYLKGHGIQKQTVTKVFEESKAYFGNTLEVKQQCNSVDGRKLFGYDGQNEKLEKGNTYRESFNMPPYPFEGILDKLNPQVQGVVTSLLELAQESEPLIQRVLATFAKSLNLDDEDYFIKRCLGLKDPSISNLTRIKSCFYPHVPGMKVGTERCSTHSDFGLLTLLWQDEGGGLEIMTKDGGWISAKHIPGTVLVNTGNLLEYWSGGRYPATIHRVGVSDHEIKNKLDRQSLAYFIIPDDEVRVAQLLPDQSGYGKETAKTTETVSVREYMKLQLDSVY